MLAREPSTVTTTGSNIAIFEAVQESSQNYAKKDVINPNATMLSGVRYEASRADGKPRLGN